MSNFDDTPHQGDYFVSTDKAKLDIPFTHDLLKHTYWGSWMSVQTVMKAIDNSLCFGLYQREYAETEEGPIGYSDRQVGFARVVTDYATYAWLCDVVISSIHRGRGLGRFLVGQVMNHPDVRERSVMLTTQDAHGLYQKFGFTHMPAMKRLGGKH